MNDQERALTRIEQLQLKREIQFDKGNSTTHVDALIDKLRNKYHVKALNTATATHSLR